MAILTAYRDTPKRDPVVPDLMQIPIAANTKIFVGGMVALDVNGRAVPAGTAAAVGPVIGIAQPPYQPVGGFSDRYDNSAAGSVAGAQIVIVRQGVFKLNSGTGVDAVVQANVGQDVYAIDDNTVGLTPGAGATSRSRAGKVHSIDAGDSTPWVLMGMHQQSGLSGDTITLPVTLSSLAAGGGTVAGPFTPGYAGRIESIIYVAAVSGAGAGASFAFNLQIGGVSTTGGVCTVTLANSGFGAAPVAGTAITGANNFAPNQTLTLVAAAGTVFTAGSGYFLIQLG